MIGIDYGARNVGIAVSDGLWLTAGAFTTFTNDRKMPDLITALAAEKNACGIVIGLPLEMDGTAGAMAETVTRFSDQVCSKTLLPVLLWDERLTSKEAARFLGRETGLSGSKKAALLDRNAAARILQNVLDRIGNIA